MSEMNVTGTAGATSTYTGYQDTAKTKTEEKTKADETKKSNCST